MLNSFFIAFVIALLWAIEKLLGTSMVIRPIVVSPIIGFILNDLHTGLLIGASLELIFMGAIQIGGAVPPDVLIGSGLATSFAIISSSNQDIAVALALPIAILCQSLKIIIFIIRSYMMNYANKLAEEVNFQGLFHLNNFGLFLQCLMYFIVSFLVILLGSDIVSSFINVIPESIMHGLKIAGGLLPSVGFSLLLLPMMNNKNIIYFIFGFTLVAFTKIQIIGITIIGILIAYIVVFEKKQIVNINDMEDLFDA